jgi:N4-gp56 family major capsid protein
VPLKGKKAVTPMVLNPNKPRGGDNLGQRGSVGWKTYSNTVILNDAWMARLEAAVTN